MLRRITWILIGLISALILVSAFGFFIWRIKAPSWKGQVLKIALDVPANFEIIMLGDMGTGDANQKRIAAAMERYCEQNSLAAVVFLGDNFYPVGVGSVDDPQWVSKFSDVYGSPCLKKLPFFALLGNHDYKGAPEAQIQYKSPHDPSWFMPHRFYEIDFGKRLQLVMLDSNVLDFCALPNRCTIDFMLKALRESEAQSKLVLGHHPIASASQKYPKPNLQSTLLRKLLCDQATSYIAGHSHHLEHRQLPECAMDAFIVGGGGADLYEVRTDDPASRFAASAYGFLALKVTPQALEYRFHDADLKLLYSSVR